MSSQIRNPKCDDLSRLRTRYRAIVDAGVRADDAPRPEPADTLAILRRSKLPRRSSSPTEQPWPALKG